MSTFTRTFLAFAATAMLALAGCVHAPRRAPAGAPSSLADGARLSADDAIAVARLTAERRGVDLARYKEPVARYMPDDQVWSVRFHGWEPILGNHFRVLVEDGTGEARLIPGE